MTSLKVSYNNSDRAVGRADRAVGEGFHTLTHKQVVLRRQGELGEAPLVVTHRSQLNNTVGHARRAEMRQNCSELPQNCPELSPKGIATKGDMHLVL